MKSLVTGATGFVGSHIVEKLIAQGHDVIAFARKTSDTTFLESLGIEISSGGKFGDMTPEEFESFDDADKKSLYTIIRRNAEGELQKFWYHEYFKDQVEKASVGSFTSEARVDFLRRLENINPNRPGPWLWKYWLQMK